MLFIFGLFLANFSIIAQEEEQSAEVFLEEYTNEFQETFFEALKQKGIQNYDRAVELFLKCKNLDPMNSVVDYELGKAYFLDRQYIRAQEYAMEALISKPDDFWYLESLLKIMQKQGTNIDVIKHNIPFQNTKLQENLVLFYFKKKRYKKALKMLEGMKDSEFVSELTAKIDYALQSQKVKSIRPTPKQIEKKNDPVAEYRAQLEKLLAGSDLKMLVTVSKEALDSYPLQPYFHYAYGTALGRTTNPSKAIEVLESALDYILDDVPLTNKIYEELSKAYTAIGNPSKANEYSNKIKQGM